MTLRSPATARARLAGTILLALPFHGRALRDALKSGSDPRGRGAGASTTRGRLASSTRREDGSSAWLARVEAASFFHLRSCNEPPS